MALVTWFLTGEQRLLRSIACEPQKNFFYLAHLATHSFRSALPKTIASFWCHFRPKYLFCLDEIQAMIVVRGETGEVGGCTFPITDSPSKPLKEVF